MLAHLILCTHSITIMSTVTHWKSIDIYIHLKKIYDFDLLRLTQANAFAHFAFLPRIAHAVIITVTV